MFEFKQDERAFWKTMNPRRLHALFNAYYSFRRGPEAKPKKEEEPQSLAEYFMRG